MVAQTFWSYNMGPVGSDGRTVATGTQDIRALLSAEPGVLALQETIGYGALPNVKGYARFRDRSSESRANVAAYVRADLLSARRDVQWRDMHETWGRTKHDGRHPARSWLSLPTRFQCVVGHQPPMGTDNVLRSQQEGLDFLTKRLSPWVRGSWAHLDEKAQELAQARPRIVLADWNRGPGEDGPGPKALAEAIDCEVVGVHIDCAVVRGVVVRGSTYQRRVGGVTLHTDHPWGTFAMTVSMDRRWT